MPAKAPLRQNIQSPFKLVVVKIVQLVNRNVASFLKRELMTRYSWTPDGPDKVDFAKSSQIDRKELSCIKEISGPILLRDAILIPAVTNRGDCDITDLAHIPGFD